MNDRSQGLPRPAPGTRGVKEPGMRMATANWPGAAGPKGPRMNKMGFSEIKAGAKQDMNDDFSAQGMMGGASSGASMGAMAGPWGALAGGIIGALLGAFTGKNKKEESLD